MSALLIKIGVRLVAFTLVFAFVAWRSPHVTVRPRIALPLVGLVFAFLNTGLYWLGRPILDFATLGAGWLLVPFILNGLFVWATARLLRVLHVDGVRPMVWLAVLLTAVHGLSWLILDHLIPG